MYRQMSLCRAALPSLAFIFLNLQAVTAAETERAQGQVQGTVAPGQTKTTVTPPLFQGIMVDAKGKTVGRIYFNALYYFYGVAVDMVIRQIDGIWMGLPVSDFTSGFTLYNPDNFAYWYQSSDCTGQAYMPVNGNILGLTLPFTVK
jgi:hypothetical protein